MLRNLALLACGLMLTGCTTWVNIPAQRGDMAVHNPNDRTAREVMAMALARVVVDNDQPAPYAIDLPDGAHGSTYQQIIAKLPEGAAPRDDAAAAVPVYRVKQVQVRGWQGQVDLIPPSTGGSAQLMSVYLKRDWHGWFATRTHLWRMPVINALRISRPMTPPGMAPIPHRDFDPGPAEED